MFENNLEHLLNELSRIEQIILMELNSWRVKNQDIDKNYLGLCITDEEIDSLISQPVREQETGFRTRQKEETLRTLAEEIEREKEANLKYRKDLRLHTADEDLNCIHVHNAKTLRVLSSLPAGSSPVHVDISSDRKYLAATNRISGDLTLYDLEKETAGGENGITIPLKKSPPCHPYHLIFSRDPSLCYVTDFDTGELMVIDLAMPAVVDRIRVGNKCFGMALDETGSTAYICTWDRASVALVDLDRRRVVEEYRGFGEVATHCAIDAPGHQLIVTCQGGDAGGAVRIMDLETREITTTITDEKIQGSIGVTIDV